MSFYAYTAFNRCTTLVNKWYEFIACINITVIIASLTFYATLKVEIPHLKHRLWITICRYCLTVDRDLYPIILEFNTRGLCWRSCHKNSLVYYLKLRGPINFNGEITIITPSYWISTWGSKSNGHRINYKITGLDSDQINSLVLELDST